MMLRSARAPRVLFGFRTCRTESRLVQAIATRSAIAVIVSTALDPNSFLDLWVPTILDHHSYKYACLG